MRQYVFALIMLLASATAARAADIHACVNNGGVIKIVGARDACGKNETSLTWSTVAPVDTTLLARIATLESTIATLQAQLVAEQQARLALAQSVSGDLGSLRVRDSELERSIDARAAALTQSLLDQRTALENLIGAEAATRAAADLALRALIGNPNPDPDPDPGCDPATSSCVPPPSDPACSISTSNFGDKGALAGSAYFDGGTAANDATDDKLEYDARLETTQPADTLSVLLYAGYGVFAAGSKTIAPGTYQITGDETDFATCGICVLIGTNATATGHEDDYMAVSGTVTIAAAGTGVGGTLTGSLSNIQFRHVNIDQATGATTRANDSCSATLTNATFTGIMAAPAGQ